MPVTVPIEKDIEKSHLEGELHLLYLMLLIRRFEERASQAISSRKLAGFAIFTLGRKR